MTYDERIKAAQATGLWTDVRMVRMFGRGLVLRGLRHFQNSGVWVSTNEDVPMTLEEINKLHKPQSNPLPTPGNPLK